jgi:hypothetical protein
VLQAVGGCSEEPGSLLSLFLMMLLLLLPLLLCAAARYCKLWEALRTDYEIEKRFDAINRKVRRG